MFPASTVTSPAEMLLADQPLLGASQEPGLFSALDTHSIQLPGPLTWRVDRRPPADLSEVRGSLWPGPPLGALQSLDFVSGSLSPGWKPLRLEDAGPGHGKGVTRCTSLWSRDSAKKQSGTSVHRRMGYRDPNTHAAWSSDLGASDSPATLGAGEGPPRRLARSKGDGAGSP